MKLDEIQHIKILHEEEGVILFTELSEGVMKVGLGQHAGGILKKSLQGIGKFAKKNPFLSGALASYGASALQKYNKNKRNTVKFYTKDSSEKKLYKDIVKQLLSTGKYRLEKESFVKGGYLFVLKKLG